MTILCVDTYMRRCLELAANTGTKTSPNPKVGAVIVAKSGDILAEGAHLYSGADHAEVSALKNLASKTDLSSVTMYVNLEPCCHQGKTGPCSEIIIKSGIKQLVIGMEDPDKRVAGQGIIQLKAAGINVKVGVLEDECRFLNRRFITQRVYERPYIILKWAQTADAFIAREDYSSQWISCEKARELTHVWRSQEDAILVGTTTALVDNPSLTARMPDSNLYKEQPIRVFIDRANKIPTTHFLFDGQAPTICVTEDKSVTHANVNYVHLNFDDTFWPSLFNKLAELGVLSVLIEGGSKVHQALLDSQMCDELRVFHSQSKFGKGILAAKIPDNLNPAIVQQVEDDRLEYYFRGNQKCFEDWL